MGWRINMAIIFNRTFIKNKLRKLQDVDIEYVTCYFSKTDLSLLTILMAGLLFTVPAIAHHNTAKFDFRNFDVITGVVKLMDLRNPHSLVILEVENEQGQIEEKMIDGHAVNMILRSELKHNMVKPGDEVTIIYAPSRIDDDMFMRAIQIPDGRVLTAGDVTKLKENEMVELAKIIKIKSE
jgi:hypothetical protein